MKKSLQDYDFTGKRALVRIDFNVPLKDGKVLDDTKIRQTIPTLSYLREQGAKIILLSHFGRPKGNIVPPLSLKPVANKLAEIMGCKVQFCPETVGAQAESQVKKLKPGEVLLLENTRFNPEESKNTPEFAKALAMLGEIFVNDAFGSAHRAHASTVGITNYLPSVNGFLMEQEISGLSNVIDNAKKPVLAILGGAKVSDKLLFVKSMIKLADVIFIGGGLGFTFLKATGNFIGDSMFEGKMLEDAKAILKQAELEHTKIILPLDVKVGLSKNEPILLNGVVESVDVTAIRKGIKGLDIGAKTLKLLKQEVHNAKTILWNGPLGVFENKAFAEGTFKLAEELFKQNIPSIIGGGDSIFAFNRAIASFKKKDDMKIHVSTGGGATLDFLADGELVGINVLSDK